MTLSVVHTNKTNFTRSSIFSLQITPYAHDSIINLGNPNGPMRIPNSGQCFPGKLDYNAAQSVFVKQDVDKNGNLNFGG